MKNKENQIQVQENDGAIVTGGLAPLSVDQTRTQINLIQQLMRSVLLEGEHYGKIPGCGDKKVLLKSGAEKIGMTFRLIPEFEVIQTDHNRGHREYRVHCTLTCNGIPSGYGVGCASTMESKYRYRNAALKCPRCGKEAIIKGKAEYGGGYICYIRKGGCGEKFLDEEFSGVFAGKVENEDPADYYNTCLKIAKKRANVDAIITATASSDIFTQDIEENADLHPDSTQASAPAHSAQEQTALKPERPYRGSTPETGQEEVPRKGRSTRSGSLTISEAQAKRLFAIAKRVGMPIQQIREYLAQRGIDSTSDIKRSDYDEIIAAIESGSLQTALVEPEELGEEQAWDVDDISQQDAAQDNPEPF